MRIDIHNPLFIIASEREPVRDNVQVQAQVDGWRHEFGPAFEELAGIAQTALVDLDSGRACGVVATEISRKLFEDGIEEHATPANVTIIDIVRTLPEIREQIVKVLSADPVDERDFRMLMNDLIAMKG